MLYLHHSNRLEQLSVELAQLLAEPLPAAKPEDWLKPETIVVQNAGMGRWLSLQLARANGIAANLRYLFPAEMTWELLRKVLENVPERDPCSPRLLRWRLLDEFSQRFEPYHDTLGHYLKPGQDDSAWQLAQQVARVFDAYLFFRPDWVKRWESEPASDWQEQLWQNVIAGSAETKPLDHWIRLHQRFIAQLAEADLHKLPQRISFFSVPALSPGYIEMMAQVARHIDVHFFVMNPSMAYWGDIESDKRRLRRSLEEQNYITVGNPLLASWGRQGRDFIEVLRSLEPYPIETDHFYEPEASSMLQVVQHDILNLQGDSSADEFEAEVLPVDVAQDQSISIHACHSPMREVEVLYDQILAALEENPDWSAADMVVMSPEIETYAPFIEAVFAAAPVQLPFSVADQHFSAALNMSAACMQLLALPQQRFEAESVFALLEYAEIRQHFGLDEGQVQQCRDWVRAVNIRWGVDREFRRQFAEQTTDEHTWLHGLDRLLLGYAMPGERLLAGVLPYNELEGSQALVLERFLQCLHVLFGMAKWSEKRASLAAWREQFVEILEQLFPEDAETQAVYQALERIMTEVRQAEFSGKVAWTVFRDVLQQQLEQQNQAEGFLGNGITFCALMPMRSVPFKFVALLGMQDGGFPRQDTRLSFDKLAYDGHRKGDRSRRDEDRYLFLESLLSARERLYISYIGKSIQDDSELMPSVLVAELLDYLERRLAVTAEELIIKHPLQAFSQRYFTHPTSRLFSYAQDYVALHERAEKIDVQRFWNVECLPEPDLALREVSLTELIRFYRHPARHFLQQQLDLKLRDEDDELATREPFTLEPFADSEIGRQTWKHLEQGGAAEALELLLRAQGLLPHGKPGELIFEQHFNQAQALFTQYPPLPDSEHFPFHLTLGEFTLYGMLESVTMDGLRECHFGYMGAWQWVSIWLRHLVLNACDTLPKNWQRVTRIYTVETGFELMPVPDAHAQLSRLLQGYWQGLQAPLPFLPKSAWAIMEKASADINKGIAAWDGTDMKAGEASKPEYQLLYRGWNPFAEQQEAILYWAQQVFGSLHAARRALAVKTLDR